MSATSFYSMYRYRYFRYVFKYQFSVIIYELDRTVGLHRFDNTHKWYLTDTTSSNFRACDTDVLKRMSLIGIIITFIRPKSQHGAQILYKYTRRCKNVLEKDKMGFQKKKYKKGLHLTGSIEQMTLYALPI